MTSENEQWLRRQEAVEGALRHRDDERRKSQKVTCRNRQTPCCRKGEFEAVIYICCGLLGVAAVAMAIPFTIVLLHSNEDLVRRFAEGSCTVVRYNNTGTTVACKCTEGRWCVSRFPCFILYATLDYKDNEGKNQKVATQLYARMEGVTNEETCSFKRCVKDETSNARDIRVIVKNWSKLGKQTKCYYDTRNHNRASIQKPVIVPIKWDFFPFVVGIGGVALFCLSIVFCVCCLYGCKDCCIWVKENNKLCPRRHYDDEMSPQVHLY